MRLTVHDGNGGVRNVSLDQPRVLVGRDGDCDVVVDDERASRHHARLSVIPSGAVHIEDVGSTNGTWVNGMKVVGPTAVTPSDEIRIGHHILRLVADRRPGPVTVLAGTDGPWVTTPATPPRAYPPGPLPAPSDPGASPRSGWLVAAPPVRRRRRGLAGVVVAAAAAVAVVVALVATNLGGSRTTMSPAQLVASWGPSTLYVLVDQGGQSQVSGTAWVLDAKQGLVVTNAHVVDAGNDYEIGQGPNIQPASLVAVSVCDDLAVLRVSVTTGLRSFQLADQADVQTGEPVTALGYPANSSQTPGLAVTSGLVSVARTRFDVSSLDTPHYPDVIQTSAAINPGDSGGPLLDSRGRLIGVDTADLTQEGGRVIQGQGYAIGVDRARLVLAGLRQGHSVGFTGMNFSFPSDAGDFTALGLPVTPGGITVTGADPNSPAANVGFGREPSVITAINGHALDGTLGSYCQVVGRDTAGQSASFTVVLGDKSSETVTVPFA